MSVAISRVFIHREYYRHPQAYYVWSNFAGVYSSIASIIVILKARSLRSLTSVFFIGEKGAVGLCCVIGMASISCRVVEKSITSVICGWFIFTTLCWGGADIILFEFATAADLCTFTASLPEPSLTTSRLRFKLSLLARLSILSLFVAELDIMWLGSDREVLISSSKSQVSGDSIRAVLDCWSL